MMYLIYAQLHHLSLLLWFCKTSVKILFCSIHSRFVIIVIVLNSTLTVGGGMEGGGRLPKVIRIRHEKRCLL